jgi:hypothetical protein
MVESTNAEINVALRLSGQHALALIRDWVALSLRSSLPSRPISGEPISSTAKAASGSSLLRAGRHHHDMISIPLIVNRFST